MQAIVLSIGDELVLGQTVDTNSAYLSGKLMELGIFTLYHQTVADDRAAIAAAIRQAAAAADLVLVSGGLGPTEDDLTRQGLADALGEPLVTDAAALQAIAAYFAGRGRLMSATNQVQALHPAGTTMLPNSCGTAPGIKAHSQRAVIYVTPGVPSEMRAMFEKSILPEITPAPSASHGGVILTTKINTFGIGESVVGEKLGQLMDRARNPRVGTTVAGGVVSVRIRSEFPQAAQARQQLEETVRLVEQTLQPYVYSRDDVTIQESLVRLLLDQGRTLATAESCTGGLLGEMLTDVAGSSKIYWGGWITYANAMKTHELGVPAVVLEQHGAVSREAAGAMALGALERSGADLAVAITGIAGPDGGMPEKPVGTVWVALAARHPGTPPTVEPFLLSLFGDRAMVRDRAAKSAAQMLRFHLLGVPLDTIQWARR